MKNVFRRTAKRALAADRAVKREALQKEVQSNQSMIDNLNQQIAALSAKYKECDAERLELKDTVQRLRAENVTVRGKVVSLEEAMERETRKSAESAAALNQHVLVKEAITKHLATEHEEWTDSQKRELQELEVAIRKGNESLTGLEGAYYELMLCSKYENEPMTEVALQCLSRSHEQPLAQRAEKEQKAQRQYDSLNGRKLMGKPSFIM